MGTKRRRQPGTTVGVMLTDTTDINKLINDLRIAKKWSLHNGGQRLVAVHGKHGSTAHITISLMSEALHRQNS